MYDHELTPEQVEFRDTVRDFVTHEVKPVVLHPERLQDFSARLPLPVIEQASRIGLRTFSLSEESGGAGADNVTASVVMEELGAGDVDVAMPLGQTSLLARFPFDGAMTGEQRRRFLPQFLEDDACHLALAPAAPDAALAWKYHREVERSAACRVKAVQQGNGDWTLNGEAGFVANAPLASLIVLQAKNTAGALVTLLVPRDTPGLSVRDLAADATPRDQPTVKWYHGAGGELTLRDCPVPGNNVILADRANALTAAAAASHPVFLAMNLGVGRAALQAGVEYARLRVQGARRIIEHQAIATILADAAVRIEVARAILRHAAWALDHPGECTDRGVFDLPLDAVARVYTSEAVYRATEEAAECFGDSGVMLDMPLPKYLRDARIFLHSRDSNTVARFRIAESLAGFVPSSVGAAAWEREEHSMSNLRLKDGIPTPRSRGTPGRGPPGMSGENLRELRILRGTNGPDGAAPAGALRRWIALAGLLMLAPAALAQPAWKPERPVEIVTGTTGGGADRMARLIQLLSREKKLVPAPVQVVAKVGAGNSIAYL
ncbi:MAG: acyl-CoA dehydrogenase family protein [Burkholderiales bacterium]|nr:acyl-CoA dehydrogenase family protein [Burkholderiales bacterium]